MFLIKSTTFNDEYEERFPDEGDCEPHLNSSAYYSDYIYGAQRKSGSLDLSEKNMSAGDILYGEIEALDLM
jgi:hypothetical protein